MHGPGGFSEKSSLLRQQRTLPAYSGDFAGPREVSSRRKPSSYFPKILLECSATAVALYFIFFTGLISFGFILHAGLARPYVRKVAIIGAGPAGASAAYHVQKFARQEGIPVEITVYEKSDYVGGRTTYKVDVGSHEKDDYYIAQIAAKGFHTSNRILTNVVRELGLTLVMLDGKVDTDLSGRSGENWGVFDGSGIVYRQSHPTNFLTSWWLSFKLYFWYGYSPKDTQDTVSRTMSKFSRIYSPRFFPFESITSTVQALELTDETSLTGSQLLDKSRVGTSFQKNFVNAWTRRDFGQNLGQISGFAAMLAPDDGRDVTVSGGHWTMFEEMVRKSNAELKLNTPTFGARQMDWGGWVLASQPADDEDGDYQEFDSVILTTPYQLSNIEIKGDPLAYVPNKIEYASIHVTLFRSPRKLSRGYFRHNGDVPETMLTTLGSDGYSDLSHKTGAGGVGKAEFYSITSVKRLQRIDAMGVIAEEFLYRVVSPEMIKDSKLYQLLGASPEENGVISWIYRHEWSSGYPYINPRTEFSGLKLDKNFWYTSGIEELGSSMELSSLMGANVAKLVVDGWAREGRGKRPDRHFEQAPEGEEGGLFPETISSFLEKTYRGAFGGGHGADQQEVEGKVEGNAEDDTESNVDNVADKVVDKVEEDMEDKEDQVEEGKEGKEEGGENKEEAQEDVEEEM